ncbi:unnamed protein product [Cylicocyclus nassatus]|uniref:Ragulator complex protein LAMTOR1 n=1 Tax=Cylicocyclus nassatus TaxID=53992 RepID=A0AA36DLQ5_CYLNA|nr:unnamed protein product [Cylicocyclus nassatus]
MDVLKKICCCDGEDDGGAPYERFYDDSAVTPVRGHDLNSRGVDQTDSAGRDASQKHHKTKEEQEEEALNRILENTQHNIIDVSHLDGITLNTSEYLARALQYEEAIRTHDHNVSRGLNGAPRSPSRHNKRLLEDCGNKPTYTRLSTKAYRCNTRLIWWFTWICEVCCDFSGEPNQTTFCRTGAVGRFARYITYFAWSTNLSRS